MYPIGVIRELAGGNLSATLRCSRRPGCLVAGPSQTVGHKLSCRKISHKKIIRGVAISASRFCLPDRGKEKRAAEFGQPTHQLQSRTSVNKEYYKEEICSLLTLNIQSSSFH